MHHQSHYRVEDSSGSDFEVLDRHLVVNCAGVCVMTEPFNSWNRTGRHDQYLMYLIEGHLEIHLDDGIHMAQSGDMILFPPHDDYHYMLRESRTLTYFWVHFTGYGVPGLLAGCHFEPNRLYHAGVSAEATEDFRALFREFITRDGCFETASAMRLTAILIHLRRSIDGLAPPRNPANAERIARSLEHMHRHYHQPIRILDLADIEHLSISRYCTVFRECMGVSPQNFLINLRLRTAIDLMRSTDLSVKQIARRVGFEDPLYFSRVFKARKSVPPSAFMNSAGRETLISPTGASSAPVPCE